MTRFFFHTDSHTRFKDVEGLVLKNLSAARTAATRSIAEMLKDDASVFWGTKPWSMTVTDASGLIFFTIEVHGTDSPAALDR